MERSNINIKNDIESLDFFDSLLIRIPSNPINTIFKSNINLDEMINDIRFITALEHANFDVFEELMQWSKGEIIDSKREKKLKKTLFNYWQRYHFKTVPFGLFSSVIPSIWGNCSKVEISNSEIKAKLDTEVVEKLLTKSLSEIDVFFKLTFSANNTLYEIKDKYRFNDITQIGNKLNYKISSIDQNYFVEVILKIVDEKGKKIDEIVDEINNNDYSRSDLVEFVKELIQMQVLLPDFMLNITGDEPLDRLILFLNKLPINESITRWLNHFNDIKNLLYEISNGNDSNSFHNLYNYLTTIIDNCDKKKFVQIDILTNSINSQLNESNKENLIKAVKILSSFTSKTNVIFLEEFKSRFQAKYDDAFVPIMEAIDTDCGVSYGDYKVSEPNIFVNEIQIEAAKDNKPQTIDDENHDFLLRKYIEAIVKNKKVIHISDLEYRQLKTSSDEMANTVQLVMNCVNAKEELFVIHTAGNSTGINLISRFGNTCDKIKNLLLDVTEYEQSKYNQSIVAEIVHIPAYRTGNITFRPCIRKYEIPIYNPSVLNKDFQISLNDLYIGIRQNRLVLISKSKKCEIIPRLTNAHNYGKDTLPIYQILSDLSYQSILPSVQLEIHDMVRLYNFTPRIQFENVILQRASWQIKVSELLELSKNLNQNNILEFRNKYEIPKLNTYRKLETDYFLNWDSIESVQNFIEFATTMEMVFLFEFLYDLDNPLVVDKYDQPYQNEIIAVLKNKGRVNKEFIVPKYFNFNAIKRDIVPMDGWLYFKIYINYNQFHSVISLIGDKVTSLFKENKVSLFHFLPFTDPNFHIRLRIKFSDSSNSLLIFDELLNFMKTNDEINNFSIETYKREIERYGYEYIQIAESIFHIDSNYLLSNYKLRMMYSEFTPLFVIRNIDNILSAFDYSISEKLNFTNWINTNYCLEFKVIKKNALYIELNNLITKNKKLVKDSVYNVDHILNYSSEEISDLQNCETYFTDELKTIYLSNSKIFENLEFKNDFIQSIIHMHCIRNFPIQPRLNELFIYSCLHNFYKSCFHKESLAI